MTWHAKVRDAYLPNSSEAIDNATEAATILINDFGWSQAACCGLFGNIDYEGQWNPWRWQSDTVLSQSQARNASGDYAILHGYGLIGWTPAKKYQFNNAQSDGGVTYFPNYDQESYVGYAPNWSDVSGLPTDGAAQIRLIATAMANNSPNIWVRRSGEPYNYTTSQFIALTDPELAAKVWLWRAERPASIFDDRRPRTEANRTRAARDWGSRLDWDLPTNPNKIIIYKRITDRSRGLL